MKATLGKSFVKDPQVVAIEELARNTLEAAIRTIHTDFKGAVDAIGSIRLETPQIDDLSNYVAATVDEPNTATGEMSHNGIEANIGKAANG
jgi:hypothetical protein